jgi:hypothetical protein
VRPARGAGRVDAVGTSNPAFRAVGMRLRSARLAAGGLRPSRLVSRWGIKDPTYRALESGRRPMSSSMVRLSTEEFGISSRYLLAGEAIVEPDARAEQLRPRLERHGVGGYASSRNDIHARLVRLRRKAGFRTASAAARSKGWSIATYGDHEGRRRNPTIDQAVAYGIAYGDLQALDYLLFDDPMPE